MCLLVASHNLIINAENIVYICAPLNNYRNIPLKDKIQDEEDEASMRMPARTYAQAFIGGSTLLIEFPSPLSYVVVSVIDCATESVVSVTDCSMQNSVQIDLSNEASGDYRVEICDGVRACLEGCFNL